MRLLADEARLEQYFRAAEALVAYGDDLTIGQLVILLKRGVRGSKDHLRIKITGDVGERLLDVFHDFPLGGRGKGVSALPKKFHHVVRQVPASKFQATDRVWQRIALVHRHGVRHAVARVEREACAATGSEQREHRLGRYVNGRRVEGFEHDLRQLLTVRLGVQGGLCEQHQMFLGRHSEFVVEGVVPDSLHVVPVRDNAVLDGIVHRQDTPLVLSLVPNVSVLVHSPHTPGVSDNGRKNGTRMIVACEACLHHARAAVHDQGLNKVRVPGTTVLQELQRGLVRGQPVQVFHGLDHQVHGAPRYSVLKEPLAQLLGIPRAVGAGTVA
mmetsp:Transcript_99619/g.281139  ORF Transcript_99619/g.281139 Transcript_99619/m.281139 type:complete len:327 (+) Transcript_99619:403-1383(+)